MKLNMLFEGWEELGIADPGMESPGATSREAIEKIRSYFSTYFPDVEHGLMPSKSVDVETFLIGQYPFTVFIADSALEGMPGPRANAFFANLQDEMESIGWSLPREFIQHDAGAEKLILVIMPQNFEL
jgi:hypothetical protein